MLYPALVLEVGCSVVSTVNILRLVYVRFKAFFHALLDGRSHYRISQIHAADRTYGAGNDAVNSHAPVAFRGAVIQYDIAQFIQLPAAWMS